MNRVLCAATALLLMATVSPVRGELVAFYNFNDASNSDVAVDASGKGNNGEVFDAVYTDDGGGHTGQPGDRAMDFGTVDNGAYVELVTAADGAFDSLVDNDQATISLWLFGSDEQPVDQWTFYAGPGRQLGSHVPWSNGNIYFDVAGCCGANQRIEQNEPDPSKYSGQWNNYTYIKDEGYTAIYQNGELWLDSGLDEKDPLFEITEFFVGAGPFDDQRSYSGMIDDFGIWDTALSEEDIAKIYEGTYFGGIRGDFNNDGVLDAADINDLTEQSASGNNDLAYDLNGDAAVNALDVTEWISADDIFKSWVGDANLDGEFNSGDLVAVLSSGTYEVDQASNWSQGDFNGDGRTNSGDLVAALSGGGYELGPKAAVASVPEPASGTLLLLGSLCLMRRRRGR